MTALTAEPGRLPELGRDFTVPPFPPSLPPALLSVAFSLLPAMFRLLLALPFLFAPLSPFFATDFELPRRPRRVFV